MNGMDLFAGSGIGSLALKNIIPDYKTVCYVEWEAYCQAILISRIKDGLLDDAPIWDDVRTFDGKQWNGKVDIVYGGFPCQPFSVAGKNKGAEDERNMWPDTFRIISEVRPQYIFLENVPNLLVHKYIRQTFGDLAEIGYDCEWDTICPCFIGASHSRARVWILAYPTENRRRFLSNDNSISKKRGTSETLHNGTNQNLWQTLPTPKFWGSTNGIPPWVGYGWKTVGNGWVPQVVRRILEVRGVL